MVDCGLPAREKGADVELSGRHYRRVGWNRPARPYSTVEAKTVEYAPEALFHPTRPDPGKRGRGRILPDVITDHAHSVRDASRYRRRRSAAVHGGAAGEACGTFDLAARRSVPGRVSCIWHALHRHHLFEQGFRRDILFVRPRDSP